MVAREPRWHSHQEKSVHFLWEKLLEGRTRTLENSPSQLWSWSGYASPCTLTWAPSTSLGRAPLLFHLAALLHRMPPQIPADGPPFHQQPSQRVLCNRHVVFGKVESKTHSNLDAANRKLANDFYLEMSHNVWNDFQKLKCDFDSEIIVTCINLPVI